MGTLSDKMFLEIMYCSSFSIINRPCHEYSRRLPNDNLPCLQVISAAELMKTPAVLNEGAAGASVSSREPTSRGEIT